MACELLHPRTRSDVFDGELGRLTTTSATAKFFYNFRHNYRVENRSNWFRSGGVPNAIGNYLNRINWGSMLDDVYTVSPTMVVNTRLNWTRFTEANDRAGAGVDNTKLGFPGYIAAASQRPVLAAITLTNFQGVGSDGGDRTPYDIFQFFLSITKIQGKHSLKFGTDVREARESSASFGNSGGAYSFASDYTRGPLDNSTSAPLGQDLASFILGYPTGGSFNINGLRTNNAKYYAVFLQDDFRPRSNLTINLGLRYEGDLGTTERFNRSVNGFDPKASLPIAAAAVAAYAKSPVTGGVPAGQFAVAGGVTFLGQGGSRVYEPKAGNFSPRFGIAWTPARQVNRGARRLVCLTP
jgi:outer membrane receptor protein involved in Fe transport